MPYIKLNSSQYRQLTEAFMEAFPDKADLRALLLFEFAFNIAKLGDDRLDDIVMSLILEFESSGKLLDLLDKAVQQKPGNAKLQSVKDTFVPLTIQANVDHFSVCFIGDEERALINRLDLRESLKNLIRSQAGGKRVLVVKGPPVSGKSYSFEMISYLYEALQNFKFVWIDLKPYQSVTPEDIARRIVDRIGLPDNVIPIVGQEQDSRWIQSFCDRLEREVEDAPDIWLLVIDGFTQWKLSDFANELIHELARRIRLSLPRLRMVLLGYEGLPPDIEKTAIREEIKAIDERDLINFFMRIYEERQKTMTPDDITNKVAEVLRAVDPSNPRRVELIGAEVARVCKTI